MDTSTFGTRAWDRPITPRRDHRTPQQNAAIAPYDDPRVETLAQSYGLLLVPSTDAMGRTNKEA
jgi:hypothetical protein